MKRYIKSNTGDELLQAAESCLDHISSLVHLPNLQVVKIVDFEDDQGYGHVIAQLSNGYELYVEIQREDGYWLYHGDIYDDTDGEYELGADILDWCEEE